MARGSNGLIMIAALGVGGYLLYKSGILDKLLNSSSPISQLPAGAASQLPALPPGQYSSPSSTPASSGYPSSGGISSGGGVSIGGGVPNLPPIGNTGEVYSPAGRATPAITAPASGGKLNSILKGGRQYCSGDYCYVCLPDGSCATVSGPGITQPIMGQSGAFANSTGIIGKICDSKGNCWECSARTCVNANLTAGGKPGIKPTARPPASGGSPTVTPQQQDCNAKYPQAALEAFKCFDRLGTQAGKDCMNAVLSRWPRFKVCLLGGSAPATQQPAYQAPAQSVYQQPSYQPPVQRPSGGGSQSAILDAADLNGDGIIGDADEIAANRKWTEGRLGAGNTTENDNAIRLITHYWSTGARF